eukprot:243751-Pyramimonas_sp.AAC.1
MRGALSSHHHPPRCGLRVQHSQCVTLYAHASVGRLVLSLRIDVHLYARPVAVPRDFLSLRERLFARRGDRGRVIRVRQRPHGL